MTVYDVIRDPTTGAALMTVCTYGPLADEEKTALAALQLLCRHERTPDQQSWLDAYLAETETVGGGWYPAEARGFPDRCCQTCGKPCQYPPQCRECSADEEGAAKRRADR